MAENVAEEIVCMEKVSTDQTIETPSSLLKTAEIRKAVSSVLEQAVQQVKSLGLLPKTSETVEQSRENTKEVKLTATSGREDKTRISKAAFKSNTIGFAKNTHRFIKRNHSIS